jgi:hypothetical protein
MISRLNVGFNRVPGHVWQKVGIKLARIFPQYKLELTLFCQLYLIAATQTRAKPALVAPDERELRLPSWLLS